MYNSYFNLKNSLVLDGEVPKHAQMLRMGFKPQNALKCSEFAYKGEYITAAV